MRCSAIVPWLQPQHDLYNRDFSETTKTLVFEPSDCKMLLPSRLQQDSESRDCSELIKLMVFTHQPGSRRAAHFFFLKSFSRHGLIIRGGTSRRMSSLENTFVAGLAQRGTLARFGCSKEGVVGPCLRQTRNLP